MKGKLTTANVQFCLPEEIKNFALDKNNVICIYSSMATTRDLIISILFQEWPLTTKAIYSKLKRLSYNCLTYQAVHKQIKKLLNQGILTQTNGKLYMVSEEWLDWITNQTIQLKKKYQELLLENSALI